MAAHILLFLLLLILAPDLIPTHRALYNDGGGHQQAWAQSTTGDQESFRAVEVQDGPTCMKVETCSKLRHLDEILDSLFSKSTLESQQNVFIQELQAVRQERKDLQRNLHQQHQNQTILIRQQLFTDIQQIEADALLQMQDEMRRIVKETVQSQVENLTNQLLNRSQMAMATLIKRELNTLVQQHHQLSLQLMQLSKNFTNHVLFSGTDSCYNGLTFLNSTTGYHCSCISGCLGEHCHIGTPMRLINNNIESLTEGRLEVFYRGQWGTVCDDSFNNKSATIACRSLNLRSVLKLIIGLSHRPTNSFVDEM